MSRILFITVPSLSIFCRKSPASLSLSMGACFLVGRLEELNYRVDHFDLNLALGKIRDESYLDEHQQQVLTDLPALNQHLSGERRHSTLDEWAETLLRLIPQEEYKYIALSFDRRDYSTPFCKATLHFGMILATKLKLRFPQAPLFGGGRRVYETLGNRYMERILEGTLGKPILMFTPHESFLNFPDFINKLEAGLNPYSEEARTLFLQRDVFMRSRGVVPSYRLMNSIDALNTAEQMFPKEILHRHPELQDIEPFFLAPYKFTVGCQFRCAFCRDGERSFFNKSEVEEVMHVLSHLVGAGVKNFLWYNNNINFHKSYVENLCSEIVHNKLNILFSDSANLRIATPDVFTNLAQAGCVKLYYGTETVSDRLLRVIDKKATKQSIVRGLTNASNAGIYNGCNFIFNFPHESDEEFKMLVDFVQEDSLVDTCFINEFKLLVDTSYWERPEEFGIVPQGKADNGIIGAYDEINGLKWEEKVALGAQRMSELHPAAFRLRGAISQNDALVFGMRRIGKDKGFIKKLMWEIQDHLIQTDQLKDYISFHAFSAPDREIVVKNSIHNNEISHGVG